MEGGYYAGQPTANFRMVSITPTLDTAAYSSGDVLFATTALANAVRVAGALGQLIEVCVEDQDDVSAADLELYFYDANVSSGAANSAVSVTDADDAHFLGKVTIFTSEWTDLGPNKVAHKTMSNSEGLPLLVRAASGSTSLYVFAVTRGANTQTANGLTLLFKFRDDNG